MMLLFLLGFFSGILFSYLIVLYVLGVIANKTPFGK